MDAMHVWKQSVGSVTTAYYAELQKRGPAGVIALNLFRANKCSARAKVYRGGARGVGSYRSMAYQRKQWSIDNLVESLMEYSVKLRIPWGWQQDKDQPVHCWVIYVDLPTGQVSFHCEKRGKGPDYPLAWDGERLSTERICEYCEAVMTLPEKPPEPKVKLRQELLFE